MSRITIPFEAMTGKTVEKVEVVAEGSLSIIVTFTDGTTLWADDPTVYGDSEHSIKAPELEFAPSEDMAEAWAKYQKGQHIEAWELRKLDEERADWREDILG